MVCAFSVPFTFRLQRTRRAYRLLVSKAHPFAHVIDEAAHRVLVMGDNTAVGVGVDHGSPAIDASHSDPPRLETM